MAVGRAPHIIPSEVMKATRMDRDFVGYAPNPHHRRGAPRERAYRAAAALQNKRAESREKKEDAKRAAAKRSGGGSVSPLPKLYHRVEVRLSANRARFEEFDFSFYNRTRLLGLVNDLANCYVNPVLQMLHFVPGAPIEGADGAHVREGVLFDVRVGVSEPHAGATAHTGRRFALERQHDRAAAQLPPNAPAGARGGSARAHRGQGRARDAVGSE